MDMGREERCGMLLAEKAEEFLRESESVKVNNEGNLERVRDDRDSTAFHMLQVERGSP